MDVTDVLRDRMQEPAGLQRMVERVGRRPRPAGRGDRLCAGRVSQSRADERRP